MGQRWGPQSERELGAGTRVGLGPRSGPAAQGEEGGREGTWRGGGDGGPSWVELRSLLNRRRLPHLSGSEAITGQGWNRRARRAGSSMQKGGLPHRTQG